MLTKDSSVLVIGANGFIGSAVVRYLLDAGYSVKAFVRNPNNISHIAGLPVDIVVGDTGVLESLESAMRGCSVVINLAASYTFLPFWEKKGDELHQNNLQGTINVITAAINSGIQRYIHTSTIVTIGKRKDGFPSNEETAFNFTKSSHYAQSKYLAEQEVLKACAKGLPAVVLNPGIVLGERDSKPTPSGEVIVNFLKKKYLGSFKSVWSVCDVNDVAEAHVAAITKGRIGEKYILCNTHPVTLKEFFISLENVSGVSAPRLNVPLWVMRAYVYMDEWTSHFIFRRKPLISTEGFQHCLNNIFCTNAKAVKELGYQSTPLEDTLQRAVKWYRKNGYAQ